MDSANGLCGSVGTSRRRRDFPATCRASARFPRRTPTGNELSIISHRSDAPAAASGAFRHIPLTKLKPAGAAYDLLPVIPVKILLQLPACGVCSRTRRRAPSCTKVIVIHQRVEEQEVAALGLIAPHRIVREHHDVTLP